MNRWCPLFAVILGISASLPGGMAHAADPKGYFDNIDGSTLRGWACDPDNYGSALVVHFYASNVETSSCFTQPDGNRACLFQTAVADRPAEPAVAAECGGYANHRFEVPAQHDIKNGGDHRVYAWALNVGPGSNKNLSHGSTGNPYISYRYLFSGTPSGWDYSLTKRCIATPQAPGTPNYFSDSSGCGPNGLAKRWTLAIQSERSLGQTCSGINTQSLPISGFNSGVAQFWWTGSGQDLAAHLKTDVASFDHPCGSGLFTWYVLMDHVGHGGGPLPRADRLGVRFSAWYNDWLPNAAARYIVGCSAFWDENGDGTAESHDLEIGLQVTNWGDNVPGDPEVIDDLGSFLFVDGRALGFNVPKNSWQTFNIHCGNLFKHFVKRGYWAGPADWNNTASGTVFIGHELNNFTSGSPDSGVVDLEVNRFEIEDAAP